MPHLKAHFDEISLTPALWIQRWFWTLFLTSFPLGLCIRIWDNLLVKGIVFLFKVPLVILRILEDKLLELDLEEVRDLFDEFANGCGEDCILPNAEDIIKLADSHPLTEERLATLKDEYYKAKI